MKTPNMSAEEIARLSSEPGALIAPLSRIDGEHLAILLWDYFGARAPASIEQIIAGRPAADANDVALYRMCAWDIIASLERGR